MNVQTYDGFCYECFRHVGPVVEIGTTDGRGHIDQESGGTFCLDCLRKAVALLVPEEPEEPEEEPPDR